MTSLKKIDFPLLVRPSYVLGGRSMKIVYHREDYKQVILHSLEVSPLKPILIDKYLVNAIELDVDAICDGTSTVLCGVMEHIEEAGIHSGDSGCVLPPQSLSEEMLTKIQSQTDRIACALNIRGFINIQFALKENELYFLEVNPRGSRTVPFLSKAIGVDWVEIATQVMLGHRLKQLSLPKDLWKHLKYVNVKEPIFPFDKFPEEDTLLGPEMKSTGEVMGIGNDLGEAYYKAEAAVYRNLPLEGSLLVTINSKNHTEIIESCKRLHQSNFIIYATEGTSHFLWKNGIEIHFVHKMGEDRPDIRDKILDKKINLIFNTPIGKKAKITDTYIRLLAETV